MLFQPDCIPCILRMTISTLRNLPLSESEIKGLYTKILNISALRGHTWNVTSEEVIELVMEKIIGIVASQDPFCLEKMEQNTKVLELYPTLKRLVNEASDPLYVAAQLAMLGNAIDLMMSVDTHNVEGFIKERLNAPVSMENYKAFKDKINRANLLLYFADNAGEIVFDKLLIETIRNFRMLDVVFVVRNVPTLNDATLKEAQFVKIDEVATLVDNGIEGRLPGTILSRCSESIREWVRKADLIISKGGGNFGTLDEQKNDLKKDITFMLLSKCYPYERHFGVPIGDPVLFNYFGGSK